MKPSAFEYHAPETADEAVELLADRGDDAKVIAGGQSLIPMLSLRLAAFAHLVDVGRIADLKCIQRDNGAVVVGAGTVDAAVEASAEPATAAENAVLGQSAAVSPDEVGRLAVSEVSEAPSDLHGSAGYRTRVGAVMVARAWVDAIEGAADAQAAPSTHGPGGNP